MTQQKKQNEEKEENTKVINDEESQKQPKILERWSQPYKILNLDVEE